MRWLHQKRRFGFAIGEKHLVLRVVPFELISLGMTRAFLAFLATVATHITERKYRSYEHEDNDSSDVAHLTISFAESRTHPGHIR